jgi:nitrite reductase/ring-hydroxylating ferredoxin subunit
VHAAGNVAALTLFSASLVARRTGARGLGRALGFAGLGVLAGSGYLGGYLSFARGVGVNHAFNEAKPKDWTPVLEDAQLAEGTPVKVEVDGTGILLYRTGDRILAIGSCCSHAGGPLQQGEVDAGGLCVKCPWHGSVFRLEDGDVVHGPASVPQTAYAVRSESGKIEVRARH